MPDVNELLDRLVSDSKLQSEWEVDPINVLSRYDVNAEQRAALLQGDIDTLIEAGLADRHVQQMRVSW